MSGYVVYSYNVVLNGKQEPSDLMRELEALGAELKRSHDELDKSRVDVSPHRRFV